MRTLTFGLVMVAFGGQLSAQGIVRGVIKNDEGRPLPGVELFVPTLEKAARTDSTGEYKLVLPAGTYWMNVRAMGYFSDGDSVEVEKDVELIHDFALSSFGIRLDTVSVTAERAYMSSGLRGFEERRKTHMGRYIAEAELRKQDNRLLSNILRKVPGLFLIPGRGTAYYAASGRLAGGPGGVIQGAKGRSQPSCFVTVYLDGILLSDANLSQVDTRTIAGVEFYSGPASAPAEWKHNECGLMMLWTRER